MAKRRIRSRFFGRTIILFVIAVGMVSTASVNSKDLSGHVQSGQNLTTRSLQFPPGNSLGRILVGNERAVFGNYSAFQQVAGACGVVKVQVPAGQRVLFEANRRVFEDPACLNTVSPVGIDAIKLNLISLDDREDDMCDRALSYVRHFTNLTEVSVDRSDATDAGVAKLKEVPSLIGISCFLSAINGACFKDLAALPALKALWLPECNIRQENMHYLAQFPRLQELDLYRTHLDENGCKGLAGCKLLQQLSVRGNPRFNDQCLKQLAALPKLAFLDTRATPVTIEGFKNLQRSQLLYLVVPETMQKDIRQLKKMFPKADVIVAGASGRVDKENSMLYAPLH
jgi:hypothetical protein